MFYNTNLFRTPVQDSKPLDNPSKRILVQIWRDHQKSSLYPRLPCRPLEPSPTWTRIATETGIYVHNAFTECTGDTWKQKSRRFTSPPGFYKIFRHQEVVNPIASWVLYVCNVWEFGLGSSRLRHPHTPSDFQASLFLLLPFKESRDCETHRTKGFREVRELSICSGVCSFSITVSLDFCWWGLMWV